MDRHPTLDLSYTHETAIPVRQTPRSSISQKPTGLGLTARLRGLQALFDRERDQLSDRAGAEAFAH